MKTTLDLVYGLPLKELIERLVFHDRQGEISERAVGFYLLDLERQNGFAPEKDVVIWAQKNLPNCRQPHKLILLARRLEELPAMAEAFARGEVPWTKIREVARVATCETEEEWLALARRSTSREIERAVQGVKRGGRPGKGLKARRVKRIARLPLSAAEEVIWGQAIRKMRAETGSGTTPSQAAIAIARLYLSSDAEGNLPGRKRHERGLATIVLHLGRDGKRWVDTEEGRRQIDRETFEEIARPGARTLEVKDLQGSGDCPAIRFGERGKAAPGERDRPVSKELKEAVLLRDGGCALCGRTEGLTPHHLDSHADGGASEMERLVTLCLDCQGAVHGGDLLLRIEEDGTVSARDLEGRVVTRARSAAEVLAEAGDECPLVVVEERGTRPAAPAVRESMDLDPLDALPGELTARQWRALERWIEWSASQRAFLLSPDCAAISEVLAGAAAEKPREGAARHSGFDDFVGQNRAVENLLLAARAAKARREPLAHVVLSGPPGVGKTTLARLLAREFGPGLEEAVGGTIADPLKLISLLTRLPEGGFLFIDEIHAIGRDCEESLYLAMDERMVGVALRLGARTRILRVKLEPFTLVGATTRLGALSEPFRSRFPLRERLEPYEEAALAEVVTAAAVRMGTRVSPEAAREVARRSRGTPRDALRLLERARDVSQIQSASSVELAHVGHAATRMGIDHKGLDLVERRAVKLLLHLGRPVGEGALAARIGVDRATFHEVHEPWLERAGLIERTERGRVATEEARRLYGSEAPMILGIPVSPLKIMAR